MRDVLSPRGKAALLGHSGSLQGRRPSTAFFMSSPRRSALALTKLAILEVGAIWRSLVMAPRASSMLPARALAISHYT